MIPEELRGRAATEQTLRERAESRLASTEAAAAQASEAEVRRLLHELQVHQIELELQNEELRSAQVALSLARDRYNDLYDFAPVGYLTLEEDTRILEANFEASKLLGVERSRLIGSRFTRFVSLESVESLHRHQRHVLTSGTKQRCGLLLRRLDGTQFPVQLESIRMMGADQLASRWQLVIVDVSERKEAEAALQQSEESFRVLAELVPSLLCSCDERGRKDYISPRFCEYTGIPLRKALGHGWITAVHPSDIVKMRKTWRKASRDGKPWEHSFRLRSADGTYRWFMGRSQPLRDAAGRVVKWLGCDTDIDAIVRRKDALRDAGRRKDEFLATLVHELRNPLAPLVNAVEILRAVNGDVQASANIHDMMERQLGHMIRLVDDLLEVSRISRGKIHLVKQSVMLNAVIRHAVETSQPLMDAASHKLTISLSPKPVVLQADPVRLAQVFANLLNNAAKYTPPGGTIELSSQATGDAVMVSIRDSGIGIAEENLSRVFDLFTQVNRERNGYQGGLGIGLALARSLIEMHGGRITAHSAGPGLGSEFVIVLPVTNASQPADDAMAEADSPVLLKQRILLVDDNHDAGDSLAMLLTRRGASTHVAYDGASAMSVLESFQPTAVLLDLGMPGMNGFELAQRIRQHPRFGDVVLIAMTGWEQDADRCRFHDAGFDHHLVKPVNIDQLQEMLV